MDGYQDAVFHPVGACAPFLKRNVFLFRNEQLRVEPFLLQRIHHAACNVACIGIFTQPSVGRLLPIGVCTMTVINPDSHVVSSLVCVL